MAGGKSNRRKGHVGDDSWIDLFAAPEKCEAYEYDEKRRYWKWLG